jgi:hypothetical protein
MRKISPLQPKPRLLGGCVWEVMARDQPRERDRNPGVLLLPLLLPNSKYLQKCLISWGPTMFDSGLQNRYPPVRIPARPLSPEESLTVPESLKPLQVQGFLV